MHHALYAIIEREFGTISKIAYQNGLNKLVKSKALTKEYKGNATLYGLTAEGRILLYKFSDHLDHIVKEQLIKYGNGFNVD